MNVKEEPPNLPPPDQAAGLAQSVPEAESNRIQGNVPSAIGGKGETGRSSSQSEDSEFATNRADTSDADDPNDAQTFTSPDSTKH